MQFFREHARILFIIAAIIFGAFILYLMGALRPLLWLGDYTIEPMQVGAYRVIDRINPLYTASDAQLQEENIELKNQLADTVTRYNDLLTQLDQYQEYSEQLAFAQESEYEIVPVEIISRVGQGVATDILTVNRGSLDGLKEGYPVMYDNGVYIGVVYDVFDTYAEVAIVSSQLTSLQATIQTDNPAFGIISGDVGEALTMDFILKEQLLSEGDVVVTSGEDEDIPAGLLIGTVDQIRDEPSELFKSATVRPLRMYGSHSIVSVIIPN